MTGLVNPALRPSQIPLSPYARDRQRPVRSGERLADATAFALLVVGSALWLWSLPRVDLTQVDDHGLIAALPAVWYAAVAALVVGAVLALMPERPAGWLVTLVLGALVVALFGTVPAVSPDPHYAWVYKHIGVTRSFLAQGYTSPTVDIYNRWPGFFALSALLSRLAGGADPASYAAWSEVVVTLLACLLLAAAVRAVTDESRVVGGSVLFFVLSNWVGQTYYAPQGLAVVLSLAMAAVVLHGWDGHLRPWAGSVTHVLERPLRAGVGAPLPSRQPWPPHIVLTLVLGLAAALVVTHQLTPYVVLIGLAVLTAVGVLRRPWVLLGVTLITGLYLLPNLDYLESTFGLFSGIDPLRNAAHSPLYDDPVAGKRLTSFASTGLTVLLWLGAAGGTLLLARRGLATRALPLVLLVMAPFAILFGQSYGGEAGLRVVLFSTPWSAVLLAWALGTLPHTWGRTGLTGVVALTMAALFVPAFLGKEQLHLIPSGEVRASEYFYAHAPEGGVPVLSAPNFPLRLTANYPDHRDLRQKESELNLLQFPRFRHRYFGSSDVESIARVVGSGAAPGYLIFSTSQETYARVYRLTPPGALPALERLLVTSGRFRLWHGDSDVRIYSLVSEPSR